MPDKNSSAVGRRAFVGAALALSALPRESPGADRDWSGASPTRYPEPDVEVLDPRFSRLYIRNTPIRRLHTGMLWAEGPAWSAVGRYLVWSDIPDDVQLRWLDEDGHVSVMRRPAGNSNGNTFDREGRQISCEHGHRRVVRYERDGSLTVLADKWNGKPLNAPNDVVVHPDGGVWFTDPGYGSMGNYEGHQGDLEVKEAVYRVDPGTGALQMVTDTLGKPNGLCFSPDHKLLYVADTGGGPTHGIRVFDVADGRTLANGRSFATTEFRGRKGGADGIRCDTAGHLWAGCGWAGDGYDGVHVFAPDGTRIGLIKLPEICSNVCFGGAKRNRLFMTASQSLYAVYVEAQGALWRGLRSQLWFDDASHPGMTALYLERYLNYGLTLPELRSGRPIIGIAQSGSDLVPCNRHHLTLAQRVKEGIRDAGGIGLEFPMHPLQETGKRPTAALDRNLAYLGLVEVLHGYPLDGVVLTTGCDKTTPAALMAAATVNIPAIVLSGGPMLDGHFEGQRVGSGTIIWHARRLFAKGELDYEGFVALAAASAPSAGHCNTMGTALSMNCIAEALGMSLPGCAAIPAPYRERAQMAYATGKRAVELVREDLTPARIMTRAAFENAIVASSAIGASSNCPPHLIAIARHMGVPLDLDDWQAVGHEIPLLVNCQPVGEFLGEGFHRAGGLPAVMAELLAAGRIRGEAITVTGRTVAEDLKAAPPPDRAVVKAYAEPLRERAGYLVLSGNLFDSAVMKVSAIDDAFRERYLSRPGDPDAFEARAIVFEEPEDYHARINDPVLPIDAGCVLFIRNCGTIGYPGSAEVVNMQPPDALIQQGIESLPTCGDGRQSGTSASPSILNASPEAAVGGGLALLATGDRVRVDLKTRRVDVLLEPEELERRRAAWSPPVLLDQTPWQEIYRKMVGQLSTGGCLEGATLFLDIVERKGNPRHSH